MKSLFNRLGIILLSHCRFQIVCLLFMSLSLVSCDEEESEYINPYIHEISVQELTSTTSFYYLADTKDKRDYIYIWFRNGSMNVWDHTAPSYKLFQNSSRYEYTVNGYELTMTLYVGDTPKVFYRGYIWKETIGAMSQIYLSNEKPNSKGRYVGDLPASYIHAYKYDEFDPENLN